ncbi:MAG: transglutaminase-like cysteine peptidase [Hyphomicrobiaceae bacterium]
MWSCVVRFGGLIAAVFLVGTAEAEANQSETRFMRVFGTVSAPFGFVDFCHRHPAECRTSSPETARFDATPLRLAELDRINRSVNASVIPATDLEIYGVTEYWTFPGQYGDCEDYAILKRRLLIDRGWPASALLLTVVRDEEGEGHAVLTARTLQGDFILDNKTDDLKVWTDTNYHYIMRQSYLNSKVWMALDQRLIASPDAIAGIAGGN